jgi:DNA-binding NtrC family response regulator
VDLDAWFENIPQGMLGRKVVLQTMRIVTRYMGKCPRISFHAGVRVAKDMRSRRILFVDDEEGIRLTLPPILTEHGFTVKAVGKVSDALVQINRTKYDVLVSDLNIHEPGDGFLVIAAMHLRQPKCVNLVLTGYPALNSAVEGIRQEIADYFVKPVEIEELVNAINLKLKLKSLRSGRVTSPKRKSTHASPE